MVCVFKYYFIGGPIALICNECKKKHVNVVDCQNMLLSSFNAKDLNIKLARNRSKILTNEKLNILLFTKSQGTKIH